ncbi:MAG: hypothetical protein WD077_09240 [Bacteroidia bacterium]
MKSLLFLFLMILFALPSFAQKKKKKRQAEEAQQEQQLVEPKSAKDSIDLKVFDLAVEHGDYQTAIHALYYIMAKDPEESYLDSLATLYYINGSYVQAIIVGRKHLDKHPVDTGMLELVATAEQEVGRLKESLALYEKLHLLTGSPYYQYQVAVLQYNLKRYGEGMSTVQKILQDPASRNEQVQIQISQSEAQNVPLQAASYNLAGIIMMDLKEKEKALENFENAIRIFPEFVLARKSLETLKKQ